MRALYVAAAISAMAPFLMGGCGGGTYSPGRISCAQYKFAPPIKLAATGAVPADGQSTLTSEYMELRVAFERGYRDTGIGVRLLVRDEQGITHNLEGDWPRQSDRISANVSGDATVLSGYVEGVISPDRHHFDGLISIHLANGLEYSTTVSGDD